MKKQNPDTKAMRKEREALRIEKALQRIQDEYLFNSILISNNYFRQPPYMLVRQEEPEKSFFDKIKSFFIGGKS